MATKNMNSPSPLTKCCVWRRLTALIAITSIAPLTGCGSDSPTVPVRTQVAKLVAQDGEIDDSFGNSVAISGDTAIVGAWFDDDNGEDSGSAYIFKQNTSGEWNLQSKLLAPDGAIDDRFGSSVAIDGDTAIIGAPGDGDNGPNSGAAFVYVRDERDVWKLQTKLIAVDGTSTDYLGRSVAISGDTAVIGAFGDDDSASGSGSAYVFVRDASGTWTQQSKLIASDGGKGDIFGISVAINDDTIVVGAPYDNNLNGEFAGATYVFVRDANNVWTQQAKLLPFDGTSTDAYGFSVAISGDTVIAGAYLDDDAWNNSGSVYIFVRGEAGEWAEQVKLLASDGSDGDRFGSSVAINGDTALVCATGAGSKRKHSSSAYIFVRNASGVWEQQTKLIASDGVRSGWFGGAVAISGDTTIVGATFTSSSNSGAAYIFDLPQKTISPAGFSQRNR